MLTNTFLHAQGIGPVAERKLWGAGFLTWDDVLGANPADLPLKPAQCGILLETLRASQTALQNGNFRFFAHALPQSEHWRVAPEFMDKIGFLDIETNGGFSPDSITIIGVYDGFNSRIFVKYDDLEQFTAHAEAIALWVTFYGTGFDIPFLRRRFPEMPFDQLHIDLCALLKRLGYKGGLKRIERTLGISRPSDTDGLSGSDAVRLWRQWRRFKNRAALDLLIDYNKADIENLALLLAFAYGRMKTASGFPG